MLSQNFRRVKAKVKGLDADACMYTCRHTYAKRTLEGYWTGKPTSIKTLARLMGNTVQVCIEHYLRFSEADTPPGLRSSIESNYLRFSCHA